MVLKTSQKEHEIQQGWLRAQFRDLDCSLRQLKEDINALESSQIETRVRLDQLDQLVELLHKRCPAKSSSQGLQHPQKKRKIEG